MKNALLPTDRKELLQRIRSLSLQSERRWGRMTVEEMVCHLSDTFRVSLGERTVVPVGNAVSRSLIKWIMLYSPARMPQGTSSARELDQEQEGTVPVDFADDVQRLEDLVERFAGGSEAVEYDHPFFGRLSRPQWGRFHYKHMDHHLRQFGA